MCVCVCLRVRACVCMCVRVRACVSPDFHLHFLRFTLRSKDGSLHLPSFLSAGIALFSHFSVHEGVLMAVVLLLVALCREEGLLIVVSFFLFSLLQEEGLLIGRAQWLGTTM